MEMNITGSGLCPVVIIDIGDIELLGSHTRD